MAEQIAELQYVQAKKEATKGTPVSPQTGGVILPIFSESLGIDAALDDINPIVGLKAARLSAIKGLRSMQGEISFLGEPNTAGYVFDMLLTKGTTSGANPYTHPFTLSPATNPNSYTIDIAKGRVVHRFWGAEMKELGIDFDTNKMLLNGNLTALGSFTVRKIASVAGAILTLATDYSATPTTGLVAGDLLRIFLANGTVVDTTVTSITGTTVTVGTAGAAATGDLIGIRPTTPTLVLSGNYFTWGQTEFRFGATAAAALSNTHTPVEEGSGWNIIHEMRPDEGVGRSGSIDRISVVRGTGDIEVTTRVFFDTSDDYNRFLETSKRALVIRHFAGATNQHELRVTVNNMVGGESPVNLEVGGVLGQEITWKSTYDTTDGAMFDVKVLNAVATI